MWTEISVQQDTTDYSYTLTGLEEYTNYTIYIRSNTSAGSNTNNNIVTVGETDQGSKLMINSISSV